LAIFQHFPDADMRFGDYSDVMYIVHVRHVFCCCYFAF